MSIKIENVVLLSPEQWESIIVGMRHPLLSYDRMDSGLVKHCEVCKYLDDETGECTAEYSAGYEFNTDDCYDYEIGQNDLDLMMRLRNAGTEHRKFMRMITVYMDITAPLYWWKEFDTYKVGTVANSCSTMHKIHAKEFTLEDFSTDQLSVIIGEDIKLLEDYGDEDLRYYKHRVELTDTIHELNFMRKLYLAAEKKLKKNDLTKAERKHTTAQKKKFWWQMIQLLPSSYNQKRKIMLNYEVLASMYHQRKNHKLDEWPSFCSWIETLPYSELITGINKED